MSTEQSEKAEMIRLIDKTSAKKSPDIVLKWVVVVVVIVVFVLVAFTVGLLVGYGAFKESGKESSRVSSSPKNCGSDAIVDGRTVNVLE